MGKLDPGRRSRDTIAFLWLSLIAASTMTATSSPARAWGDGPDPCAPGQNLLKIERVSPGSYCLIPGDTLVISITMSCMEQPVAGFQAFIEFDPAALAFTGGSYNLPNPFGLPILSPIVAVGGSIDLAAGINVFTGQTQSAADATLATLTFAVQNADDWTSIDFRTHEPPSRFTTLAGSVATTLASSPSLRISPSCIHPCSAAVGDVNGDELVDLNDIAPAVDVLLGLDAAPEHIDAVDANCDGQADGADIQPFVDYLLSFM